ALQVPRFPRISHYSRSPVEAKRLAIEIIATLVHVKNTMAKMILEPAGIPPEVYSSLLYRQDVATGRTLSKRQIAPLILDAMESHPGCGGAVRRLISIAAQWSSFHLANDEYEARATVQKARELLGALEIMEAREAKQRELARKAEMARMEKERVELLRRESELLMMFDHLAANEDPQERGYLLEDLLNRLFNAYSIPVVRSFRRNQGGEQIDGAFKLEGWHYLMECRWRKRMTNIGDFDGLGGKISRSGRQTMGLFLSVTGWSGKVVSLLKQNPNKAMIMMDGYDLRTVLSGQADLREFILAKGTKLNLHSDPFLSASDFLEAHAE
ncbi:MAG: hypothetical protein OXK74_03005, partial [Gemmatimonadota bacterium]|nr:hypothetical protein [Gemmatimonadota bacterium]